MASKLDLLCNKSLYLIALNLAQSEQVGQSLNETSSAVYLTSKCIVTFEGSAKEYHIMKPGLLNNA